MKYLVLLTLLCGFIANVQGDKYTVDDRGNVYVEV